MSRKTADRRNNAMAWQGDSVRATVMAAAERFIAREGYADLTLTKVALEAGLAAPAVFVHFASRNDLFHALIASSLHTFFACLDGRDAIGTEDRGDEAEVPRDGAAGDEDEQSGAEQGVDGAEMLMQATSKRGNPTAQTLMDTAIANAQGAAEVALSEPDTTAGNLRLLRKQIAEISAGQFAESDASDTPDNMISSVEARLARLEARKVDSWLERRLRVFERTMSELQSRQDGVDQRAARADELMANTVAGMRQLIEESEVRQKEYIREFRSTFVAISSRVDGIEARSSDKSYVLAEAEEPSVAEDVIASTEPAHDQLMAAAVLAAAEPHEFISSHGSKAEPVGPSFLAAARRAASSASPVDDGKESMSARLERLFGPAKKSRQTRQILACFAFLILTMAATGLVLSQTMARSKAAEYTQARATAPFSDTAVRVDADKHLSTSADPTSARARAELVVGLEFLTGQGRQKDFDAGAKWLERAANDGDPIAAFRLATLYEHGIGVEKDISQAARWYEAAALQGNRKAMHNLAVLYVSGNGIAANFEEAARWFSKAANLGYTDSAFNLAVLYERGEGVPQSLLDACKWYGIAAAAGDHEAQARVDVLKTQLKPNELAAAEQVASTFTPLPLDDAANAPPSLPEHLATQVAPASSVDSQ